MLKFLLVEIETSFPMRLVLCTEAEMMSIQKKENMTNIEVNQDIFYFELSGKTNVDIIGIIVSMWKCCDFKNIFTSNDVMKIQYTIGKEFGY